MRGDGAHGHLTPAHHATLTLAVLVALVGGVQCGVWRLRILQRVGVTLGWGGVPAFPVRRDVYADVRALQMENMVWCGC